LKNLFLIFLILGSNLSLASNGEHPLKYAKSFNDDNTLLLGKLPQDVLGEMAKYLGFQDIAQMLLVSKGSEQVFNIMLYQYLQNNKLLIKLNKESDLALLKRINKISDNFETQPQPFLAVETKIINNGDVDKLNNMGKYISKLNIADDLKSDKLAALLNTDIAKHFTALNLNPNLNTSIDDMITIMANNTKNLGRLKFLVLGINIYKDTPYISNLDKLLQLLNLKSLKFHNWHYLSDKTFIDLALNIRNIEFLTLTVNDMNINIINKFLAALPEDNKLKLLNLKNVVRYRTIKITPDDAAIAIFADGLSKLTKLKRLDLNAIIPKTEIGPEAGYILINELSKLHNLIDLDLSKIIIPDILKYLADVEGAFTNLEKLNLSSTHASIDIVPPRIGQKFPRLKFLNLSKNRLNDEEKNAFKEAFPGVKIIF